MNQPKIDLSPKVSDEIRKTTCYMCNILKTHFH